MTKPHTSPSPPPDTRTIFYLDRNQDGNGDFREALAQLADISTFHDLGSLLNALDDAPPRTFLLLDTTTLLDEPSALISRLVELRRRLPMGLVTDQDLDQFIWCLRRWGIIQCAVKTPPVTLEETEHFLQTLSDPASGFSLMRYFSSTMELYSLSVTDMATKTAAVERVINHFATHGFDVHELYDVRLILEEITNNAFFHAFRTASGEEKYSIRHFASLDAGDENVRIEYGNDGGRVGFSVTDNAGTLGISTIITKLERQFNREGIFDESGRGLYLSRMLATKLIINIEQGKRTQLIALFDETRKSNRPKPFMINYIGRDQFEDWRIDPELDFD
ncbi:MAG: ATP-binding protein [Sumerlaeia bacterium]